MSIDVRTVALFVPPHLAKFKLKLFERIGSKIQALGGYMVRDFPTLESLPASITPIVGCTPELRPMLNRRQANGEPWIYWDRGYCRRVFATWLPPGADGGYYRWHLGAFQMTRVRDVPDDRWAGLDQPLAPWRPGGRHILVAEPSPTYQRFHQIDGWTERVTAELKRYTDRPLRYRTKESKVPLGEDITDCHALVSHGSNAAVEAAIMGCPVFVDKSSAAALVGLTDLAQIEHPIFPDRVAWARSLAYCQFNEAELVDGTLWRLME